jgi:serine/threonine protein kinase/Tfp pilus assembly protein PilF
MLDDTVISRAELVLAFAESLRSPKPPPLSQFIAAYPEVTAGDLAELIMIDQSTRWAKGDRPLLEDYMSQLPQLAGEDEELVSLLGYEFELRQLYGESLQPEQYYDRFPELRSLLHEHFRMCHVLSETRFENQDNRLLADDGTSKFNLFEVHAEGGLGRVWRAHDRELQREVAVKQLRPELADRSEIRERFLREARVTGQLEHPNIVPVYELIEDGASGQPSYAMRFVRGQTLSEAVRRHFGDKQREISDTISQLRLLNAFISVCNAVAYAHSRGIVHRDLKPENIVLGRFGEVFVADWGLAKIGGAADAEGSAITVAQPAPPKHTVPGSVMGTPAYMAPEQAAARNDQVDERTDIYGLGAILYVILTGRPPHEGTGRTELLEVARTNEFAHPRTLNRSIPPALEAICLKAMARLPERRYKTATEVAQEVQRWMVDEPIEACPEPWHIRVRRWITRHRIAAAVACLIAIGLVGTSWAKRSAASSANLRRLQARQESADRFARFQRLTADAYFYGLAASGADIARAARNCDEALDLYNAASGEPARAISDPNLDETQSKQLARELAQMLVLRAHLLDRLPELNGRRPDLDAAVELYKKAGIEHGTWQAYFSAEQNRTKDKLEDAIRDYQQVLGAEPQHYWALTGLGHCYLRTGQPELARVVYQSCIALQPRSPWPWMQRGIAAAMARDAAQAHADFERALQIDSQFIPARFNLGLVYASRGEHEAAIERFGECLLQRQDVDVLDARAKSWIALEQLPNAVNDVEAALRLQPNFAPALVTRARITTLAALDNSGQASVAALRDLERALNEDPNLVSAHVQRAKVLELMGNLSDAIDSLGHAIDIVRFDAAIVRERARLLTENDQKALATQDYSRLIRSGHGSVDDLRRSGDCHADLELWSDAIRDYSEAINLDPGNWKLLLRRAQCHTAQGDLIAALADCDRILQEVPSDADAQALKSRIQRLQAN